MGIAFRSTSFFNPTPLLPPSIRGNFGELSTIDGGKMSSLSIQGGYGHTFIYQDTYFLSLLGGLGISLDDGVYKTTIEDKKDQSFGSKGIFGISTGHNSDNNSFSFLFTVDGFTSNKDSLEVSTSQINARFAYGHRFKYPRV